MDLNKDTTKEEIPKISFEEFLKREGELTYTNVGVSMMPLLRQGKDLFTVKRKGPERCRKGDVVLYRRRDDYVRQGRQHSTREAGYRLYSFFVLHTIGARVFLRKFRSRAAGLVKKGR